VQERIPAPVKATAEGSVCRAGVGSQVPLQGVVQALCELEI
jgi:hypothetical protein